MFKFAIECDILCAAFSSTCLPPGAADDGLHNELSDGCSRCAVYVVKPPEASAIDCGIFNEYLLGFKAVFDTILA